MIYFDYKRAAKMKSKTNNGDLSKFYIIFCEKDGKEAVVIHQLVLTKERYKNIKYKILRKIKRGKLKGYWLLLFTTSFKPETLFSIAQSIYKVKTSEEYTNYLSRKIRRGN